MTATEGRIDERAGVATRVPSIGEYFEPAAETMSRADLEAYQEARILELVPYAYEHAPLVRKTWDDAGVHPRDIFSLADFRERAPFTSKEQIRSFRDRYGDPFGGIASKDIAALHFVASTTGTTGEPALFPEAWEGVAAGVGETTRWGTMPTLMTRDMWMAGVRPGDRALLPGSTRRGPWYQMVQLCGGVPVVTSGLPRLVKQLCELSVEHRPTALYVLHMTLLVAIDHLSDEIDMCDTWSSYRSVVFAGEPLGRRWRARAHEWGMNLVNHTSAGDVGGSTECYAHDGCHLWEDKVLVEHLDEHGAAVPDGSIGELVSTALDPGAGILLRYRSDDLIRLTRERCRCGRTHARQWPVGRRGDEVVIDGRSVLPLDIWSAIESLPETSRALFQLIRPERDLDVLRVRVGYDRARTTNVDELRDRIAGAVLDSVGLVPSIELVDERELMARTNGKVARVVKS
jgi:phenylacetate-CoA ligase